MQLDGEMALPPLNITLIDLIYDVTVSKKTTNESEIYMQEKLGKWKIVDLETYLPLYIIKVLISLDN